MTGMTAHFVTAAAGRAPMVTMLRAVAALALCCAAGSSVGSATPPLTVTLNDGHAMPVVSLGTCCQAPGTLGVVPWVAAGGVGIDTAIGYGSEVGIAAALRAMHPRPNRSALFITTKIHAGSGAVAGCAADPALALKSVHMSLKNLGVDYIDLVLLHRPCQQVVQDCLWNRPELRGCAEPFGCNCFGPPAMNGSYATAANAALWRGLEQAVAQGLVRSIGVSNYSPAELAALGGTIVPAVNQCEMSVEGADNATLVYCSAHGIHTLPEAATM